MKYFSLQALQVFRRQSLMIFLFFGAICLFQISFILASTEEKKIEEIKGSTSLEAISADSAVQFFFHIRRPNEFNNF